MIVNYFNNIISEIASNCDNYEHIKKKPVYPWKQYKNALQVLLYLYIARLR